MAVALIREEYRCLSFLLRNPFMSTLTFTNLHAGKTDKGVNTRVINLSFLSTNKNILCQIVCLLDCIFFVSFLVSQKPTKQTSEFTKRSKNHYKNNVVFFYNCSWQKCNRSSVQFQEIIHERDINEGIGMFYYRIKVQFQETVCERDIVRAFIEILYFFNIRIIILTCVSQLFLIRGTLSFMKNFRHP